MQVALHATAQNDFYSFLHSSVDSAYIDLSASTLIHVMHEHQEFKRRYSRAYKHDSVISMIEYIQRTYDIQLMPKRIDEMFYTFLYQHLITRGLKPSTIQNYFVHIRTALRWGLRYGCPVSATYDVFNVPKYRKTMIALTPDEISHIYHFNIDALKSDELPNRWSKRALTKVRDCFVLQCNLGQRASNILRVSPEHFNATKDKFTIIQQKTANKAIVDIHKYAFDVRVVYEILERYNYTAPYQSTINNYNTGIHLLLKLIGQEFDRDVISENKINGMITEEKKPMWQMVSSHTARRSFVTHAMFMGYRELDIRIATGHKDSRSFERYYITNQD